MTVKLGKEHAGLVNKLLAVLATEPEPTRQQIALELAMAWHAMRVGDEVASVFVVDSMHKHVMQIVKQWYRENWGTPGRGEDQI